jgi:hypothetical protein
MGKIIVAGSINMDVVARTEPAIPSPVRRSSGKICTISPAEKVAIRRWPPLG